MLSHPLAAPCSSCSVSDVLPLAMHPNTFRWCTAGFFPCHTSKGIMPSTLFVGHRFRMYTAVATASPQNQPGSSFALSMLLAVATTLGESCTGTRHVVPALAGPVAQLTASPALITSGPA
ncbi:unnamed protein product [Spirodela intermedia]|uniref:Uncharacterized protein n=1 Tax=Spirodela intermedia TaxID=51605 RepID=A0A7I8K7S2_SPIIN|nr:unnamed protein product [Spirodela intermedia]